MSLKRPEIRTRVATFYSLNESDTQVLAMLNECIQTAYEKVVHLINTHATQTSLTKASVVGEKEYAVEGMGVPTYVGYKAARLTYLPYETLKEKYDNFSADTSWDIGDPQWYSLVGFDGDKKTLIVIPTPKEISTITILCFQYPPTLTEENYIILPPNWSWLVVERAKIERLRFERDNETYVTQTQEFVAYLKVFVKSHYPAAPEVEAGFKLPTEREAYNKWRSTRQ